jgi:signal transduction histidine kinase
MGMSEGMEWVEVIVSDSGIGIDPEHLDRIFEKFYQTGEVALHSTGKTKFKGGGPGLGLAIAKGIIEAHGGKIWAESEGHDEETCPGSRFHVVLPVTSLARMSEIPSPFSYTR